MPLTSVAQVHTINTGSVINVCGLSLLSVLLWFFCGFSVFFLPLKTKLYLNSNLAWNSVRVQCLF